MSDNSLHLTFCFAGAQCGFLHYCTVFFLFLLRGWLAIFSGLAVRLASREPTTNTSCASSPPSFPSPSSPSPSPQRTHTKTTNAHLPPPVGGSLAHPAPLGSPETTPLSRFHSAAQPRDLLHYPTWQRRAGLDQNTRPHQNTVRCTPPASWMARSH